MNTLIIQPAEEFAEDFLNIVPASSFIPEWYRKSEGNFEGYPDLFPDGGSTSTYKKCSPFFDALSLGYIVYLTADIQVTKQNNGMPYITKRVTRSIISEHSNDQWSGLPCPEGYAPYVYKWHNQHILNTPKGYSLLFTNPFNRTDLPFQTLTGVVDTDVYNLTVHFPFFIKESFVGIIKNGTPICQIIPIKRDAWQREIKEYQKGLYEKNEEKLKSVIKRAYKTLYWHKKEYK